MLSKLSNLMLKNWFLLKTGILCKEDLFLHIKAQNQMHQLTQYRIIELHVNL
jgi:hypothetical protein